MRVLIACESSGTVRDAFRALGHDAWSCDLLEDRSSSDSIGHGYHIMGDAIEVAYDDRRCWDLMIAHPPCTYLCSSGLHWNTRRPDRAAKTDAALNFFADLFFAPIKRKALENPIGCVSTRFRKPDQIIQPHQFGDDASKATCLWLEGLPKLQPTSHVAPRLVNGRPRWSNQTDSGQNRLPPSADRWQKRSVTYRGIASAMASQWGNL